MKQTDFPIFEANPQLVYLDSGATTHKPKQVIDAMSNFLNHQYGTVHRGIYDLSVQSTNAYNSARQKVSEFIGAKNGQIIFSKGTTDGINLAASGYLKHNLAETDEIIISEIEHHANFVPWQMLAKKANATIRFIPVDDDGNLDTLQFKSMISKRTKMIAITHISNVLGSVFPIQEMIDIAKDNRIPILIDGAQAIAHEPLDMAKLDPDFYCFSGHKMYGPTGIGVCFINNRIIDQVKPIVFGGDMIELVSKEHTTFAKPPLRFEAGTPAITEAIGLGSAIDYIQSIGINNIKKHEDHLTTVALKELNTCQGITIYGQSKDRSSAISFNIDGIHPHDLGTILDTENIAIRVGHHCSQPTMKRFNVAATARASFGVYNKEDDINQLMKGIHKAKDVFGA